MSYLQLRFGAHPKAGKLANEKKTFTERIRPNAFKIRIKIAFFSFLLKLELILNSDFKIGKQVENKLLIFIAPLKIQSLVEFSFQV